MKVFSRVVPCDAVQLTPEMAADFLFKKIPLPEPLMFLSAGAIHDSINSFSAGLIPLKG